jgi:3-hexulose-6-phosphate synthase
MKIEDIRTPALQVALDFTSLNAALSVLRQLLDLGVGIFEVGTPLIKSEGIRSVSYVRSLVDPKTFVLADTKTVDVGAVEAEVAIGAGADLVTVLAVADDVVISSALAKARELGGDVVADFIGFRGDVVRRVKELRNLGVKAINLHVGIDVQRSLGIRATFLVDLVREVKREVPEVLVSASGGIRAQDIPRLLEMGVDIVVVGGAITRSQNPREEALECLRKLREFSR